LSQPSSPSSHFLLSGHTDFFIQIILIQFNYSLLIISPPFKCLKLFHLIYFFHPSYFLPAKLSFSTHIFCLFQLFCFSPNYSTKIVESGIVVFQLIYYIPIINLFNPHCALSFFRKISQSLFKINILFFPCYEILRFSKMRCPSQ
jgi:hypothetical protein